MPLHSSHSLQRAPNAHSVCYISKLSLSNTHLLLQVLLISRVGLVLFVLSLILCSKNISHVNVNIAAEILTHNTRLAEPTQQQVPFDDG